MKMGRSEGARLPFMLEMSKGHPRDYWNRGRVKVALFTDSDEKELINPDIPTKTVLMKAIAEKLPDIKVRLRGTETSCRAG